MVRIVGSSQCQVEGTKHALQRHVSFLWDSVEDSTNSHHALVTNEIPVAVNAKQCAS